MTFAMDWKKLLSDKRIGTSIGGNNEDRVRTHWQRDFDRIIFSSAFRRLQDKTQVFPLSDSDYPRTRLTHSLESAVVGRSLGVEVGNQIIKKYGLEEITPFDIGSIVASAALAHDIGNPPFGHSGEEAIQDWFNNKKNETYLEGLNSNEINDFLNFEGNAQGFRVLTKLQRPSQYGGLRLTYSTLGAFTKYPREAFNKKKDDLKRSSSKKTRIFSRR